MTYFMGHVHLNIFSTVVCVVHVQHHCYSVVMYVSYI